MFKTIPNYPDYMINELGDVYSMKFGKIKKLKPTYTTCSTIKYNSIQLANDDGKKTFKIHWLVWEAFVGQRPKKGSGLVIDHIDRNPMNNKLSNLRVITHSENQINSARCDRAKEVRGS